jgi:hypothetical protein
MRCGPLSHVLLIIRNTLFTSNNNRGMLEALGAFEALTLTTFSPPISSPRTLPCSRVLPSTNSGIGSDTRAPHANPPVEEISFQGRSH